MSDQGPNDYRRCAISCEMIDVDFITICDHCGESFSEEYVVEEGGEMICDNCYEEASG